MDATTLYRQLNSLFSSPHNDSPMEMAESESELREALARHPGDYILDKMKQMMDFMRSEGDPYRAKLSAVIKNRFWEKNFLQMIPYRPFKIEE